VADTSVQGWAQEKYGAAQSAFEKNLTEGADVGASFCATVNGETVVDIWGGLADQDEGRAWERDTIVNVYSTTKTMTALTALLIADRGELDFARPVARYWPEFAAAGKQDVTVAHLMSHSAGLCGWREPLVAEDLYDWEKVTSLLAAQEPYWKPGTASGYHSVTQGFLVGEVIRRITGRTVGTVFREEIAQPLGGDFHIGLPASEDGRVGTLIPPPPRELFENPTEVQLSVGNPRLDVSLTRTRAWRAAEIPAANGTSNARAVAQIQTILANGGEAGGRRFLSEAGCRKALEPQIEGTDLVLGIPIKFGLGFGISNQFMPNPNTLYWGGYGGSVVIIDMDVRTSMSYVMNKMAATTVGDTRAFSMMIGVWSAA
jgi:CubicO group peptidase (beta-lactamase class C family)